MKSILFTAFALNYNNGKGNSSKDKANQITGPVIVKAGTVIHVLFSCIGILLIASVTGSVLKYGFNLDSQLVNIFIRFFNLALELNIPTIFSFILLLIASALNFILWFINQKKNKKGNANYWLMLSLIFLFLSLDEILQLHELFNRFSSDTSKINSFLYYSWVIPYSIIASIIALFFIKFLLKLPLKTKKLFILSGFIYVGAAIGFEFFEGHIVYSYGVGSIIDVILYTIEETCEMIGVALFIYALLEYISHEEISVSFR